jgi:hypothetical protein
VLFTVPLVTDTLVTDTLVTDTPPDVAVEDVAFAAALSRTSGDRAREGGHVGSAENPDARVSTVVGRSLRSHAGNAAARRLR